MTSHKPPPPRGVPHHQQQQPQPVTHHKKKPRRSGRQMPPPVTHQHHKKRRGGGRHGKGKHGLTLPGTADAPLCAATAVAVSLLLATGIRATDEDIAALHAAAGGDGEGAALEDILAVALRRGLAGARLANVREAPETANLPGGIVASVRLELAQADQGTWEDEPSPFWGLHAAVLTEGHALTWGRPVPLGAGFLTRQALGAWTLDWEAP